MGGGSGNGGGGVERIDKKPAKTQIAAKQKALKDSPLAQVPTVGGMFAQAMGGYNLAQQQKGLDKGGYAVAVPGTSFAPQGQAYTEAPGMRSSAERAGQRFSVGSQGKPSKEGPAGSVGVYSATKPTGPSKFGYVGDVAGVVTEGELFGQKTKTFTGKTGYSPSGEKLDDKEKGGKSDAPAPAPAPEAEAEEEVPTSMAMLPGETPSQYRRRVRRFGGGTIVEGGGVLYK